jgi:hypothetical protein
VLVGLAQLGLAAACTRIATAGRSPLEAGEIAVAPFVLAIGVACVLSKRIVLPGHSPSDGDTPGSAKREPALPVVPIVPVTAPSSERNTR